jgi:hypothetical protein
MRLYVIIHGSSNAIVQMFVSFLITWQRYEAQLHLFSTSLLYYSHERIFVSCSGISCDMLPRLAYTEGNIMGGVLVKTSVLFVLCCAVSVLQRNGLRQKSLTCRYRFK